MKLLITELWLYFYVLLLWLRVLVSLYLNTLTSSFLWCFMTVLFPILLFKLLLQDLKEALQIQAYS